MLQSDLQKIIRIICLIIFLLSNHDLYSKEVVGAKKQLVRIKQVLDSCTTLPQGILEKLRSIQKGEIIDATDEDKANAYYYEGICYSITYEFGKSLVAYKKSRQIFQTLNLSNEEAICDLNIGVLYINIENYNTAIRFFNIDKRKVSNDVQAQLYYLIGYCHIRLSNHLKADQYLTKALALDHKRDKLFYEILLSMIEVKLLQHKLKAAKELIDTCDTYFNKTDNEIAQNILKLRKASLFESYGNYQKSLDLTIDAYENLRSLNYKNFISQAAISVAKLSAQLGDYKKAYLFSQIYHDIRDSLSNENNRWALNMMQAELVLTEKENKIKVLEKEKVIEKEKLRYQQLFTIGALAALLIVAFLLFFAVKNFRLSKKQNNIISLQKDKLETQVKLVNNKNLEILSSINYASRLQSAIVNPHQFFTNIFPNSFIFYQPKDIVAGDFFWCEKIENKVFFAAADCTGHGVPGALVSVVCATALNRTLYEYEKHEPGEILDTTRQLIIETFSKSKSGVMDGMDISFCVLDINTKQVTWAGANNPLWIYNSASQQLLEYKPNKQPIGNWENATPFTSHVIQLEAKDVVYLFTDGFQDQFGTDDVSKPIKKFKPAGMRKMLQSIATLAAEEQYQRVQHTFENWKGDTDQIDDVTLIGICIS